MRIGIDFDDVLSQTMEGWCDYWVQKYGYKLEKADIKHWDLHTALAKMPSFEHSIKDPFSPFNQLGFFAYLEPHEDIDLLEQYKNSLYVVTACRYGFIDKIQWLKQHMPWFDTNRLIFAVDKNMVKLDVLFDDKVDNLCIPGLNVLRTQPWNKDEIGHIRADNVKQFLQLLEVYEQGYEKGSETNWDY